MPGARDGPDEGRGPAGLFIAVLPLPFTAQNAQIWAASVLTGTEPAFVQIGGYSRGSYRPVDHALRSAPGADVQARRRRECRRRLSWPLEAGFTLPAFLSLSAGAQRPRHIHRAIEDVAARGSCRISMRKRGHLPSYRPVRVQASLSTRNVFAEPTARVIQRRQAPAAPVTSSAVGAPWDCAGARRQQVPGPRRSASKCQVPVPASR